MLRQPKEEKKRLFAHKSTGNKASKYVLEVDGIFVCKERAF